MRVHSFMCTITNKDTCCIRSINDVRFFYTIFIRLFPGYCPKFLEKSRTECIDLLNLDLSSCIFIVSRFADDNSGQPQARTPRNDIANQVLVGRVSATRAACPPRTGVVSAGWPFTRTRVPYIYYIIIIIIYLYCYYRVEHSKSGHLR